MRPRFVSDSDFSSCDSSEVHSQDLEIWREQPHVGDFQVQEKIRHLEQVAAAIRANKEKFLKNVADVDQSIEDMSRLIAFRAQAREQTLKAQLQEIGSSKVSTWNRQLKICQDALEWIRNIEEDFLGTADDLQETCNNKFISHIDFVDSEEIEFDEGSLSVVNSLSNMGRIISGERPSEDLNKNLERVVPKFMIGTKGERPGEFCRPWGVCSDLTGRILVADRSNNRIQIFNEYGNFLLQFGKEGSGPGEFSRPTGISVDKKCRVIVADKDNHRIQVFTFSGGFLFTFGSHGNKPGEFDYPWDVAVNGEAQISVSDSKNHRVQLFNDKGEFLTQFGFGSSGIGANLLDSPRGVAFKPDGSLLVTDFNNHCILIINKEFTEMTKFGGEGKNPKEFYRPQGVACDGSGRFAVADCKNYRIQVFDSKGNLLKLFGGRGKGPGEFDCLQGICFHPNGDIIITDFGNDRIQVF